MLNVIAILQRLELPVFRASAIPAVRALVEQSPSPLVTAAKLVDDLIGVQCTFTDVRVARMVACAVVDNAILAGGDVADPISFLAAAEERVTKYLADPKNAWMFVEANVERNEVMSTPSDGVTTQVVLKADGKIKKGGKQLLAADLYRVHVLENTTPITNQDFVKVLMKELNMSKAGATTYAYDLKKKLGAPAGSLVMAKSGGAQTA